MRKELTLAIVAVALAFLAVQSASFLQSRPSAAVMKGDILTESTARPGAVQPLVVSWVETIATVVLGPLAVAILCYLFIRRTF